MSKVDAQRALREARYAASVSPGKPAVKAPTKATTTSSAQVPAKPATSKPPAEAPATGLCGHRSMNGRNCTRDAGHSEKNHRYG